jgi:hypothetical protein
VLEERLAVRLSSILSTRLGSVSFGTISVLDLDLTSLFVGAIEADDELSKVSLLSSGPGPSILMGKNFNGA